MSEQGKAIDRVIIKYRGIDVIVSMTHVQQIVDKCLLLEEENEALKKENYNLRCEMQSYINAKELAEFNETQALKNIEALKAKLQKCKEALTSISENYPESAYEHSEPYYMAKEARQTLKEIEEMK